MFRLFISFLINKHKNIGMQCYVDLLICLVINIIQIYCIPYLFFIALTIISASNAIPSGLSLKQMITLLLLGFVTRNVWPPYVVAVPP